MCACDDFENVPSLINHQHGDIEDTPAPFWSTVVARSPTIKGFSQTTAAKSGELHLTVPPSHSLNRFAALQVPDADEELLSPDAGVEPAMCELEHPVDRERIWRSYCVNANKADRRTGVLAPPSGYPSICATNDLRAGSATNDPRGPYCVHDDTDCAQASEESTGRQDLV